MKHVIVGTAGHIDHGKSTLVEALTGTHPDRLEEEKRRGITIDLGFAFLDLDGVRLGFVDVPGHERFVRNMLAGAGGIDLVLLVVAADESVKPQTGEHFDICRLLGIQQGLVALTKADLVDAETLELARMEIEEFARGSFLEAAPIVAVSARNKTGLEELKGELLKAASRASERDSTQYARLPIDRVFAIKGFGTVVTGTLISGRVRVGEELELFPDGRRVRVRGVQSAGETLEEATAGQRTALNLAGVEREQAARGMVLASPGRFRATQQLVAKVGMLASARVLRNRSEVHFHQGTAETVAEMAMLEGASIPAGGEAYVQLRLREPVLVLPGDRFILRQFSPVTTIGGGVVLDNLAPRHRQRDGRVVSLLRILEGGQHEEILAALASAQPRGLTLEETVARTGWKEEEVRRVAEPLEKRGTLKIASRDPWIVTTATALRECGERIRAELETFHRGNPLLPGMPKEDLRHRAARGLHPEIFRYAIEELARGKKVNQAGDIVMQAGRKIMLSEDEDRARRQIEQAFEQAGLAVPRLAELLPRLPVDPERARKLLQLLLREGVLVKVAEDLVFHSSAMTRLKEMLAGYKKRSGERISVSSFKELAGISRKYAIPLLEHLDRERVTRRVGDERVIL